MHSTYFIVYQTTAAVEPPHVTGEADIAAIATATTIAWPPQALD